MLENKKTASQSEPTPPKHESEVPVISWDAPEYFQYQKDARWYMAAIGIVGLSIFLLLITGNWSMAIALLVFSGVYWYISAHHPPKITRITISNMGIRVGDMFFPFHHMKAFWIIYENGVKTLNLSVSKRWISDIVIQLADQDPVEVRRFLVGQIPEWEGKTERLSDILLRLLKL